MIITSNTISSDSFHLQRNIRLEHVKLRPFKIPDVLIIKKYRSKDTTFVHSFRQILTTKPRGKRFRQAYVKRPKYDEETSQAIKGPQRRWQYLSFPPGSCSTLPPKKEKVDFGLLRRLLTFFHDLSKQFSQRFIFILEDVGADLWIYFRLFQWKIQVSQPSISAALFMRPPRTRSLPGFGLQMILSFS